MMHSFVIALLLLLACAQVSAQAADLDIVRAHAEAGDAAAQNKLGMHYEYGSGVTKNVQESVKWYRMAAKQGFTDSQYSLAYKYSRGEGVPQNDVRAYMWMSIAAAQGLESAAYIRDEYFREKLSAQALEQAQAQAIRCFDSNFQDCGE